MLLKKGFIMVKNLKFSCKTKNSNEFILNYPNSGGGEISVISNLEIISCVVL